MGNYSYLVSTTNGADICVIDWDSCAFGPGGHGSEDYRVTDCKDMEPEQKPKTVKDLASVLNDVKLFGYLDNTYIAAFREVCKHMRMADGSVMFPRIYFEEEGWDRLHFLEFHPGTDIVLWGVLSFNESKDIPDYEGAPPRDAPERVNYEWEPTEEQEETWNKAKKATLKRWIFEGDPKRWKVQQLLPTDSSKEPAIFTLMSLFGIRPEDPDCIQEASKIFNVDKAMKATKDDLFNKPY